MFVSKIIWRKDFFSRTKSEKIAFTILLFLENHGGNFSRLWGDQIGLDW